MVKQDEPVSVTMLPSEWSVLLGVLVEAPYRVVAPLIQKIGEQARAQQTAPPLHRANGDGVEQHAPD